MVARGEGGVSDRERIYFLIDATSPVMDVIRQALEIQKEFESSGRAFMHEWGVTECMLSGNDRLIGLVFKADPNPMVWRKKKDYWVPNSRSKAGRELQNQLRDLPRGVDPMRFSSMVSAKVQKDMTYCGGGYIAWTIYHEYGEHHVLSVPSDCKISELPGCRELKMSEYWKIREEAVEREAA